MSTKPATLLTKLGLGVALWLLLLISHGENLDPNLSQRPLELPSVSASDSCPVSIGHRDVVPNEPYIFGAGGYWYGRGPVYFALSWKSSDVQEATFSLNPIPFDGVLYRAKTPWVADAKYSGPILVRGRRLDSHEVLELAIDGERNWGPDLNNWIRPRDVESAWWFGPSSMFIPGPGCYAVQIDTAESTDVVVFEATL